MAGPLAVADTSVLIAFHQLDLLPSLTVFYQTILVPAAVRTEFLHSEERTARGRRAALTTLIDQPPFEPCDDYDTVQVRLLERELGLGEAEALSQATLREARELLMDDRQGRRMAARQGHTTVGTLKLLARLHRLELVDYGQAVQRLRAEIHFRASDAIVKKALEDSQDEMDHGIG